MATKQFDYNFGRLGDTNTLYINTEKFRHIDYIEGWQNINSKETPNSEQATDMIAGSGNYLRTCLENGWTGNTITRRGNHFPYCFSGDTVDSVPANDRNWPALPRFSVVTGYEGDPPVSVVTADRLVGFQKYICPRTGNNPVFPADYYTLEQTPSNSYWPIRPSNGDGAKKSFSPSNPYMARIRIKLTDLKYSAWSDETRTELVTRNILEEPSTSATSDNRKNGDIIDIARIRGFINLINPDGINAITNADGTTSWPHNFNQIVYRLSTDPTGTSYAIDDNTPAKTITIFNAECAGYANLSRTNTVNQSSYYGAGIPFEVPVLPGQEYLIFDIYTDCCDNTPAQTNSSTEWWELTWSFDGYYYRPAEIQDSWQPRRVAVNNPTLTLDPLNNRYVWRVTHNWNVDFTANPVIIPTYQVYCFTPDVPVRTAVAAELSWNGSNTCDVFIDPTNPVIAPINGEIPPNRLEIVLIG